MTNGYRDHLPSTALFQGRYNKRFMDSKSIIIARPSDAAVHKHAENRKQIKFLLNGRAY